MAKRLLTFCLFFGSFTIAYCQAGKIDTDRPDQTESAVTVPRHYFQAEFGFSKENTFFNDYDLSYPSFLFRYGFNKLELRLESSFHSAYHQLIPNPEWTSGVDPITLAIKKELFEEKGIRPKTSFLFGLTFPTIASKNLKGKFIAPSFRLAMQNSLTNKISLGYNAGIEWDGFSKTPIWIYTISNGFDLGKWYAYIELFGFYPNGEQASHNADIGVAYFISDNVKIDLSGGIGLSDAAPRNYVAAGFSFRCNTKRGK
jgi:hypothetical protein